MFSSSSLKKSKNKNSGLDISASFKVNVNASTNAWELKNLVNKQYAFEKEKRKLKRPNQAQSNRKADILINAQASNSVEAMSLETSPNEKNTTHLIKGQNESEAFLNVTHMQRSSSTSYLNEQDDYGDDTLFPIDDSKRKHRHYSLNDLPGNEKTLKTQRSVESDLDDNISLSSKNNFNDESEQSSNSSNQSSDVSDSEDNDDLYAIYENEESNQAIDCDPGKI